MTNVNQNTKEAHEASPVLCQAISLVVFLPDAPELSPNALTGEDEWPALPDHVETAHAYQTITETVALDITTPAAVRSGKINSNHAHPMDGQNTSPRTPSEPDSDVTLTSRYGGSDGKSEYVKSTENSPSSSANMLEFSGHIRELKMIHEVTVGEINEIIQPTVLFYHTNKLKITELYDAKTEPTKNL